MERKRGIGDRGIASKYKKDFVSLITDVASDQNTDFLGSFDINSWAKKRAINPVTAKRWMNRSDFSQLVEKCRQASIERKITEGLEAACAKGNLAAIKEMRNLIKKDVPREASSSLSLDDVVGLINALPDDRKGTYIGLISNLVIYHQRFEATGDWGPVLTDDPDGL